MPWWIQALGISGESLILWFFLLFLVLLFLLSAYMIIFKVANLRSSHYYIFLLLFCSGIAIMSEPISILDPLFQFILWLVIGGIWRGYKIVQLPKSDPKRALYDLDDEVNRVKATIIDVSRGHTESDPGSVSWGHEDFDEDSLAGRGMGPRAREKRLDHKSRASSSSLAATAAKSIIGHTIIAAKSEPTVYTAEIDKSDFRSSIPHVNNSKLSIDRNPTIEFTGSDISKSLNEGDTVLVDLNVVLDKKGNIAIHSVKDVN